MTIRLQLNLLISAILLSFLAAIGDVPVPIDPAFPHGDYRAFWRRFDLRFQLPDHRNSVGYRFPARPDASGEPYARVAAEAPETLGKVIAQSPDIHDRAEALGEQGVQERARRDPPFVQHG